MGFYCPLMSILALSCSFSLFLLLLLSISCSCSLYLALALYILLLISISCSFSLLLSSLALYNLLSLSPFFRISSDDTYQSIPVEGGLFFIGHLTKVGTLLLPVQSLCLFKTFFLSLCSRLYDICFVFCFFWLRNFAELKINL